MEDSLHVEKAIIENELHQMLNTINETTGYTLKEKEQLREMAYRRFLSKAKTYEGAPAFKTMTIEELKQLYQEIKLKIDRINGREDK